MYIDPVERRCSRSPLRVGAPGISERPNSTPFRPPGERNTTGEIRRTGGSRRRGDSRGAIRESDWRRFPTAAAGSIRGAAGLAPAALFGVPPPMRPTKTDDANSAGEAFEDWIAAAADRIKPGGAAAAALTRARFRTDVVGRDRSQPEFAIPVGAYLAKVVTDRRVSRGRAALAALEVPLSGIRERFGIPPEISLAVWGVETSFGRTRGEIPVIDALTTLAFDGRRGAFFERELRAALDILEAGDIEADAMNGSWAGAMGHTQFMPSSYLRHAIDFDGDGRRDIWGDDPVDALASTAAYLAHNGWRAGESWGAEVVLPADFDHALADPSVRRPGAAWADQGMSAASGGPPPDFAEASILLPAGAEGPAFMAGSNFLALKTYNPSDAYALSVVHLADRIAGRGPIRAPWPPEDAALNRSEVLELQTALTEEGFPTYGLDGIAGPDTRRALRNWQSATGLTPDGHVCRSALECVLRTRAAAGPTR